MNVTRACELMVEGDVRVFIYIVEEGSLAAAARRTNQSAPMVSRILARLEAQLGLTLVHRTTRRLQLTAAGEILYDEARRLVEAAEAAEARLLGIARSPSGPLRISAPTSFGRLHVAPLVQSFRNAYPDVAVTLDLSDGYVDLIGERYDLAVRITDNVEAGLDAEWLADSRRVLCAAPTYLARRGEPYDLAALEDHELLAAQDQLPWRLTAGQSEILVNGESVVRTNSSEVVRELALSGGGIALRSLWDVGRDLGSGKLQRILPQVEGSLLVGIFAVRPRTDRAPAAVRSFVDHLRRHMRPVAPWDRMVSAT